MSANSTIASEFLISALQLLLLSTQIPCSWHRPGGGQLLLISGPTLGDFPSFSHPKIKVPCKKSLPGALLPSLLSVHLSLMEDAHPASWPHRCSVCSGDEGSRLSAAHSTLSMKSYTPTHNTPTHDTPYMTHLHVLIHLYVIHLYTIRLYTICLYTASLYATHLHVTCLYTARLYTAHLHATRLCMTCLYTIYLPVAAAASLD